MKKSFVLSLLALLISISSFAISPITGTATMCVGATTALADATTGGTWSSSNIAVASVGISTGLVSGNGAGTAVITYTASSTFVTQVVTVNPLPAPITGTTTFCTGVSSGLSDANPGGTWSSSNSSIAAIDNVSGIATGITPGTATISYTISTGCYRTTTVTVSPMPSSITGVTIACLGSTTTLSNPVPGGSWSSSNSSVATVSPAGVVTGISLGTSTITYSFGSTCYATATISVNPYPSPITGPGTVSVGSTVPLASATSGGLWTSSSPGIATVGVTSGLLSGVALGTSTISYRVSGCTVTTIVTVMSAPPAISGPATVCLGSTTTYTAGTGGTWSSSVSSVGIINPTTGVLTAISAGVTTITYDSGSGIATMSVTVTAAPPAITGSSTVCVGSTILLSNTLSGGTWSSNTTATAIVGATTGIVTGISAGTVIISYTTSSGCSVSKIITVNPAPAAITGSTSICLGANGALSHAVPGGTWTSSNPAVVSFPLLTGLSLGTSTITYTLPSGCFTTIVVTVVPTAAAIAGASTLCVGGSTTLTDATSGGTWSSSIPVIASVGMTTGIVSGINAGTATISYSLATGCTVTRIVTVYPIPSPITGVTSICLGGTSVLSNLTPGGSWISSNSSVAPINISGIVTGAALGTSTITYALGTGCSTAIVVTVVPTAAPIAGIASVCVGATTTLSSTTTGGTWTSSSTSVATVGLGTGIVTGINAGTTTISYTLSTGCSVTYTITVNPQPSAITGSTTVCLGLTTTLGSSPTAGTWSSSNPAVATVGPSTGVVTGNAAGTTTITYTLPTGCFRPITVLVTLAPAPITGSSALCVGQPSTLADAISGGTWSSSNTVVATVGLGTGVVTGLSTGTATITYALSTGCNVTRIVTVNPTPTAISGPSSVCTGSVTTYTDFVTGGVWSSSNPAILSITSGGIATAAATGVATISYTLGSCSVYLAVTVGTMPAAIAGPSTLCAGSSITLTNTISGGTWTSSMPVIAIVGSSTGVVTGTAPGIAVITYSTGSSCIATKSVTVNSPVSSISGPTNLCLGIATTFTDATPGGTWSSSAPTFVAIDPISGIATGMAFGTATLTYQLSTGCIATKVVNVTIVAPAIVGPSTVCNGVPTTYTTDSVGTWSSSTTAVGPITPATGILTGVAPGTVTIMFTLASGCFSTKVVTVVASPSPITGSGSLCVGATTTLSNSVAGGTWSSSSPTVSVGLTTGVVTGLSTGTAIITYGISTGCTTMMTLTVNPTPTAISGPSLVCAGLTATYTDFVTGGIWSSSNPAVASIATATGVLTAVSPGITTITYTISSGCTATMNVTVTSAPAAIAGSSTVCAGGSITLTDATPGGTWTSANITVASVNPGTGVVSGNSVGVTTITYQLGAGCLATKVITVNNTVAPITGGNTTCIGSTLALSNTIVGGIWTSSNTSVATVTATAGMVTGISMGVAIITYTAGGCAATLSITVNPQPAAISGSSTICAGSSTVFTDATPAGAWSSSNTAVASVNTAGVVTGVATGAAIITYTAATGCFVTKSVTVNAGPGAIGGPATLCAGSTVTETNTVAGGVWSSSSPTVATINATTGVLTGISNGTTIITYTIGGCSVIKTIVVGGIAAIGGGNTVCVGGTLGLTDAAAGGTWSVSNPAVASVGASSGVVTGIAPGIAVITYAVGSCIATKTITVNAGPAAIAGGSNLCLGTTTTLSDATSGGSWSSSNPAVAAVGATTGIVSGIAAGTAAISYTIGGCSVTKIITVSPAPSAIAGPAGGCVGTTITLTDAVGGGVWSSSNTAIASIGATTGVITGAGPGIATITYAIGSCSVYKTVTINNSPAAIAGSSSMCAGSTIALTDATAGGAWSSSNPAVATVSTTGVVTGTAAGVASISYTVGGCSAIKLVTVNATPAAIAGSSTLCVGSNITLSDAVPGGTWVSGNPTLASVDATTGVVTGNLSGFVNIYYSVGGCQTFKTITINTTPATISGSNSICAGATTTLSDVIAGGAWSSSNTAVATVNASTGVVTGLIAGITTISYTIGGCSATKSLTVNAALAPITGSSSICLGGSTTLSNTVTGGSWISANPAIASVGATSGIVSGVAVGATTIYYTAGGCSVTKGVTVSTAPAAIAGGSSMCAGATLALTDATAGGAWTSSNTAIATVGATGIVTGVSGGLVTISYSVGGGCAATKSITVNATPAAITGNSSVCIGGTTALSNAIAGGTWSSSTPARATVGLTSGVVTGLSAGAVTIYYSIGGCSISKAMTVNSAPVAITGSSSLCAGATIALSDATTGGAWTTSNAAVAVVGATGIVTGVSSGVAIITYSIGSCSVQKSVTVNAAPAAIAGSSIACIGSTITLTDATTGGTWVSSNPGVATVNTTTGVVSGIAPGFVLVYYTTGGCSVSKTVTVNPVPTAISGAATVCASASITLADATTGGTWSSSNTGIASINTAGVVTGVAPGTAVISYVKAGCGAYKTVTVNSCGLVGGKVSTGAGKGTSGTIPVIGMTIKLQDATTHATITQTNTDATGSYSFTEILYGSYIIYPEATGYTTVPSDVITLNSTAHIVNNINFVQNNVDMTITPHSPASASAVAGREVIGVYPNPSKGDVNIAWENQQAGAASVLVTSIIGTEVYKGILNLSATSGQSHLDLTNLKSGIYIITIKSEHMYYSSKLFLQQ